MTTLTPTKSTAVTFGPLGERAARPLFLITALSATFGAGLSFILTVLGTYPSLNTDPSLLGNPDQGALGRIFDFFTYFTQWSNILVAVIMWMLVANPRRNGKVFRVLRLDTILMISVTGIIYQGLLAASAKNVGLEVVTNFFLHQLTPIVVVVVWLLVGPRRQFKWVDIPLALILPIVWAIFALVRGAVIHAYPYGFLNVDKHGLGTVIITVIAIAIFGVIISAIYLGLDRLLSLKKK
jgi:hypothetical protein